MCAACCDPALHAGGQVRLRLPHHAGHRQIGHGHDGLDAVDILHDQPQAAAHVDQRSHYGVALLALEHQTGRILLVHTDSQRMGLDPGPSGGQ